MYIHSTIVIPKPYLTSHVSCLYYLLVLFLIPSQFRALGPGANHPGLGHVFPEALQQPPKHVSYRRSTLERDLIDGNTQRFKLSASNPTAFANSSMNTPYEGEGQRQAWNRGREEDRRQSGGAEGFPSPLSGCVNDSSRGHQYSGGFPNGRDGESPPNGDVGVESEGGSRAEKRKTFGGYDLNPREIYRKLSEHVIGQVEGMEKGNQSGRW